MSYEAALSHKLFEKPCFRYLPLYAFKGMDPVISKFAMLTDRTN